MGVPQFFRYICERYPCILESLRESEKADIDYFYIDMNGIIHSCSHGDDKNTNCNITEEEIFKNIFNFLDVLFQVIKPQKIFFLGVDGVAPRAKINQQRRRRFKVAKDYEVQQKKLIEQGKLPVEQRFDSNCITPGTEFMAKLQTQLEYYITHRITNNSMWRTCKVILSGHEVPGEGEHKIMEYIRYLKSLPDYDPFATHCFYGLDADLIMLGLSVNEHNVVILRDKQCNRKGAVVKPEALKFFLLHLSLLREYLDLEFQELKKALPFKYNLGNIVDDWILMGFTLGNDFIPHLPDFHIFKGALPMLYRTYIEVLPTLDGYMNEGGHLNLPRFFAFMEGLAKRELELFEDTYTDLSYFGGKFPDKLNLGKNKDKGTPKDSELKDFGVLEDVDSIDGSIDEGEDHEHEEDGDGDNEDDFLKQFWEQKKNYYENKLKFKEVTKEVLKSQAECYIRGLQWTLHYYYHGCQSWSWFYPHNYAPYISDLLSFKDIKLEFELGKPFLPYEQLLATLPPGSMNLLPKAYQHLMTSPDSPIIDYYPETFETDLNGKRYEWETLVLLPYIDETRLLKAMEKFNDELTPEEKQRNKHSPMLIYSYTEKDLGPYTAPEYGTNIETNHASVEAVWRHEIAVDSSKIKHSLNDKIDVDVYFAGFPTFKFIKFETAKKRGKANAFGFQVPSERIVLKIKEEETPQIEKLIVELLGKIAHVDWPFLTEARVVGIAKNNMKYSMTDEGPEKFEPSDEERSLLFNNSCSMRRHYLDKKGIDIGNTKIIVSANLMQGIQLNFDSSNKLICNKVWSEKPQYFPLQTLVKNVRKYVSDSAESFKMKDPFPVDSVVFMLACPYYGCMGRVGAASDKSTNGRVPVKLQVPLEQKIDRELLDQLNSHYYSAFSVGLKLGISPALVGKISGKIFVSLAAPGEFRNKKSIVNIGLGIKLNNINLEVPGYTKRDSSWNYSNKAIALIKEYVERYPHVIEYLSSQHRESSFFARADIFPGPNGVEEIMDLIDWIKSLECNKIERVPCGSKLVDLDIVAELEKIIDNCPKETSVKNLFVKPQLLFKSEFKPKSLAPIPTAEHQLFDRVIFVKPDNIIPLGRRGYIVGIYEDYSQGDCMYDILCDEPLTCSKGRRFKTSKMSFINISHGERTYQLTKQSKINQFEFSRCTVPPAQLSPGKEDQFKTLWSHLEKVKSQDETKVLKELLKIEDEKPKDIEDNVKRFFENVSESAEKMIPRSPGGEILQKPFQQSDQRFSLQLFHYFHSRNLPQPHYHWNLMESGDKIVYQVSLPNGRVYTGFPSKTEDCARDSAALQALIGLAEIHPNSDYLKEGWRNRKIQEDQIKLEKGLVKFAETDSSKSPFKSKLPNDKLTEYNKCQKQNHRKNNVPHTLPTPPLQWCRQYKNSSNSYGDQMKNSAFNSSDDHIRRSESLSKNDSSKTGRIQNRNLNHYNMRLDSPTNIRNGNWRQEEKTRNPHWEFQCINEYPRNGNRRSKQGQGQPNSYPEHSWRPDLNILKQGHSSHDRNLHENNQGGSCQTPFVTATEFIPLQALSRNRSRSKTEQSHSATYLKNPKETGKVKTPDVASVKLPARPVEVEKLVSSRRVQRKSKIAAKFDADWD